MALIRIIQTRAPGLLPSLTREIDRASNPVVLVPESFTLACEAEVVNRSRDKGIFGLNIFSPSSLVREIRELTGQGTKKPLTIDGQNMIVSQVLHHDRDRLKYYRDSAAQPTLAHIIANQINEFARARLTPDFLNDFQPASRRTKAKIEDMTMIWKDYRAALGDRYEDTVAQWDTAIGKIQASGLVNNAQLLIFGFDYITHDLVDLVENAIGANYMGQTPNGCANEVVIGLISDDVGPDREIFHAANDSVLSLIDYLRRKNLPYSLQSELFIPAIDPGIAYVEKSIYAHGAFQNAKIYERTKGKETKRIVIRDYPGEVRREAQEILSKAEMPDMANVFAYYAKNSYLECQHACQTLIEWHQSGISWEDMAIAVCEQGTLPSLLPLTLSAAGIPFNAKQDQPILLSAYAQYFLSLLRVLRLNFSQGDVIRLLKTGFTSLTSTQVMDMENYARKYGLHRSRWLKPIRSKDGDGMTDEMQEVENLRRTIVEPIMELHKKLSQRTCSGKQAATYLFQFISESSRRMSMPVRGMI